MRLTEKAIFLSSVLVLGFVALFALAVAMPTALLLAKFVSSQSSVIKIVGKTGHAHWQNADQGWCLLFSFYYINFNRVEQCNCVFYSLQYIFS